MELKALTKLLIFAPNLNGGGAERVLVNYLANLDYNKFSVTLVLVERKGVFLDLVPKIVEIVNLNKSKTIYCLNILRKLINRIKPDIVYSTLIRSHIVLILALFGLDTKPRIILRSPNSPKLLKENKMLNLLQVRLLNYCYRKANLVIAQTAEMKEELIRYHYVDAGKIKVIHNPVDKDLIKGMLEGVISPFDKKHINIIAAGRLTWQKGFDILINAFSSVVKENPKFRLYILGGLDGDQFEILQSLTEQLGLVEYVFFAGFQSNPFKYYKFADAYVLSSRWEGLPNTVLESLYLGTPVITTNCIETMNQLIQHGVNGMIVDTENSKQLAEAILGYDKINRGLTNNNLREVDLNDVLMSVLIK